MARTVWAYQSRRSWICAAVARLRSDSSLRNISVSGWVANSVGCFASKQGEVISMSCSAVLVSLQARDY